jgi:hypothetical protein
MPHNDDVLLDSSRKRNLISGPCLLHLDGGQYVKKSWSSHALASSVPWLTRASRRGMIRNLLILLFDRPIIETRRKRKMLHVQKSNDYWLAGWLK